jgi:hypothetical protein
VDGSDTWIEFTVRDQRLTSVRCIDPFDRRLTIELSQPFVNGKVEVKATFSRAGTYVIRAFGSDGLLRAPTDVTVTVEGPSPSQP